MIPHIRWMIRRDMAEVLCIESQRQDQRWYEDDFIRCLRKPSRIGMVAEHRSEIVGFMIYELGIGRLNLLSLAVALDHRRKGVGSAMIGKLTGKLSHDRRRRILLTTGDRNVDAHLFFRARDFEAISVLRDFFPEGDAYLFEYRYRAPVQPVNRVGNLAYLRGGE